MPASPDVDDVDDDAEALSWIGDEEQGRAAPRLRQDDGPAVVTEVVDEPEAPGAGGRRAATVGFALPYLVFTIGWILSVQQLSSGATTLWAEILWQFGEFLAILSAPFWLATTLSLTRNSRPLLRVGWLALGLAVLVPWPFVLTFLAALQLAGSLS